MKTARILAGFLALAIASGTFAQTKPPVAPARDVTDTYFGQTVVDPYRWMEKAEPEFVQWLRDENAYSRSVLTSIPGRDKILARLTELDNAAASVGQVQRAGEDMYFYTKTEPGANIRKLYVRKGLNGAERLLVDPDAMGTKDKHYAMDYFAPSLDGTYVIYGVSQGGSENSVLHVMQTETGRVLPDAIDRTQYAGPSWLPDGKSFFYWRSNKLPPGAPPTEVYKRMRTYLHVLGNDPDKDRAVFGYGITPGVTDDHFPFVAYTPGSPYLLAVAGHGVQNEQMLFTAPVTSLANKSIPWKKIVSEDDDVVGAAVRGNDIYLLTHKNAPRYKVVKTSLINPNLANATTVIAPGEMVVTDAQAAKEALYVQVLDGGISRIKRVSYANGSVEEIPMPVQGTASLSVDPRYLGALINLTSWTQSPLWYRYTPENKKLVDTGLQPRSPVDMSAYESLEVKAKNADGTMVPLSIILKKGTPRDGSHPTLLSGYGAYGISSLPFFDPKRVAWLELGGIFAIAHVRGGGEYGEEWHAAGQKKTKMNTIDDFIACAEYLIDQKYTSQPKLAGTGTSAGGILIGRAITKRPDLFAAAVSRVGASNPLRFEVTQGGPANVPEFGTVGNREDFESLRSFDPYINIQPNTKYPAVLLTAGLNDPRVPPWQPGKMTAKLQASSTSGKPVLLRVEFDAGHGLGSTRSQFREELADTYAFLLWQFGEPGYQPATPPAPAPTPAH
jgi:prolyl oligopeptidase